MGTGHGPKDPFGNYREWAEHRLNPGHYLGGTIEPHLRKSELGPRARRLSGIMLAVSGGAGLLSLLALDHAEIEGVPAAFGYPVLLLGLAVPVLLIWSGVTMFRSSRSSPRKRTRTARDQS